MMNRILSLALAAMLALSLAACGAASSQPPSSAPESAPVSEAVSSAAPESADASAPQQESPSVPATAEPSSAPSSAPSPQTAAPSSSESAAPSGSASEPPSSSTSSEASSSEASSSGNPAPAEGIGAVILGPNNAAGEYTPSGINELIVLVPRVGVLPGDVALTVYDAKDDSEFCSIDLADGAVEFGDWQEYNQGAFDASEGTALIIGLGEALEADHLYYVVTEAGWLTIPEEGVNAKAVTGKNQWVIRVGDFGVDFDDTEVSEVAVGETVAIPCTLGMAQKAKVSASPKGSVKIEEDKLSSDGDVLITFEKRGDITVGIEFEIGGASASEVSLRFKCR